MNVNGFFTCWKETEAPEGQLAGPFILVRLVNTLTDGRLREERDMSYGGHETRGEEKPFYEKLPAPTATSNFLSFFGKVGAEILVLQHFDICQTGKATKLCTYIQM